MDYGDSSLDSWFDCTPHRGPVPFRRQNLEPYFVPQWIGNERSRIPCGEASFLGHVDWLPDGYLIDDLYDNWANDYTQPQSAGPWCSPGSRRDRPHDVDGNHIHHGPVNEARPDNSNDPYLANNVRETERCDLQDNLQSKLYAKGGDESLPLPRVQDADLFKSAYEVLQKCIEDLKTEHERIRDERVKLENLHNDFEFWLQKCSEIKSNYERGRKGASSRRKDQRKNCPGREELGSDASKQTLQEVHDDEEVETAFERYNVKWLQARLAEVGDAEIIDIPWPTQTLEVGGLSDIPVELRQCFRHPAIHAPDKSQLRQWNAFKFFLESFGLVPCKPDHYCGKTNLCVDSQCQLNFDIRFRGMWELSRVQELKTRLREEKRRWHPDGYRRKWQSKWRPAEEEESAKAVFNAVVRASFSCDSLLRQNGGLGSSGV
ncbi:hypothetical protein LOY97_000800 [Ophidiomyces ophidiicola]|nr:hypothetical protein LOZ49_000143 [Ophidiomyces ophidiicola]KAI2142122.1 hypothetical protein LOZ29_001613 [Ophidiomyces ophidiicola]KAI2144554.1 hypothetical protein LOZ28_001376 [Ophidiomyces ophidiicola]KAI2221140.1 hypothetical protein LOZ15_002001 [Ophidiomyces ophidiicola]KAI2441842.1 hypothetical protein LOZ08_003283 [Ophidiomyces ophidiicola]